MIIRFNLLLSQKNDSNGLTDVFAFCPAVFVWFDKNKRLGNKDKAVKEIMYLLGGLDFY